MNAEDRLREFVEEILDRGAVPADERDDVAEELFGHLWERWQIEMENGLRATAAAERAIESFGAPESLGPQLTEAFHSRLYASTIGVLLPGVNRPPEVPGGFVRARIMLLILAGFQLVGGAVLGYEETPIHQLLITAGLALGFAMTVLAFLALNRAQRWAMRYAQLAAAAVLLQSIVQLFLTPGRINLLGFLGLAVLLGIRSEFAEWTATSRPTTPAIALVALLAVAAPFGVPAAVAVVPDPTQASASDLSLTFTVDCRTTAGMVESATVTARVRWSKTDFLGGGLREPRITDSLELAVADDPQMMTTASLGQRLVYFATGGSVIDQTTGEDISSDVVGTGPDSYFQIQPGAARATIWSSSIRAGHVYAATFFVDKQPFGAQLGAPYSEPLFRIRYSHRDRFGLQGWARCGETVTATPAPRDPLPIWWVSQ